MSHLLSYLDTYTQPWDSHGASSSMDIQCNTATVTTQYLVSPTQSDAPMLCQRGTYTVGVCHHHDLVGVGENTQQLGVAPVVGLGSTLLIDRLYGRHSLDQALDTHTHT